MNKELLLKYIAGDATDLEKVLITDWLESDPENMKEFLALRKLHDIAIWHTSPVTETEQRNAKNVQFQSWRKPYFEILKYVAIFVIAIAISHFLLSESSQINSIKNQSLYVPAGQRAEITLEDGTKVWINANTTLTFPNHFSGPTREVSIDGEGFFDVAKNELKPFIVKTENYHIKVWGTKFDLMAYSGRNNFETSLFEGSVEILKANNSKGILIKPDERVFLEKGELLVAPIDDLNHQLWKEGILSFQDDSFSELIDKLQLYFDMKIEVQNDKILEYRFTGKFRMKDGVEHILKVLQVRNRFSYVVDEQTNTILIK